MFRIFEISTVPNFDPHPLLLYNVILTLVILKFRNIGRSKFRRSKFWTPPNLYKFLSKACYLKMTRKNPGQSFNINKNYWKFFNGYTLKLFIQSRNEMIHIFLQNEKLKMFYLQVWIFILSTGTLKWQRKIFVMTNAGDRYRLLSWMPFIIYFFYSDNEWLSALDLNNFLYSCIFFTSSRLISLLAVLLILLSFIHSFHTTISLL